MTGLQLLILSQNLIELLIQPLLVRFNPLAFLSQLDELLLFLVQTHFEFLLILD